MKRKKSTFDFDIYIFLSYIFLALIGLFMQLNISSIRTNMSFFFRQGVFFIISIMSIILTYKFINPIKLRKFIFILLIISIISLILVLTIGHSVKGAQRSIRFFGINIQPSLFARIILILYFAHILDRKHDHLEFSSPKYFIKHFYLMLIFAIVIFALIFFEKHLSILIILGLTLFWLLWLAGTKFSTIVSILGILMFFALGAIFFGKEGYRRERMMVYKKYSLFYKSGNVEYRGATERQIRQSLICLASGKLFGTTPKYGTGKHYFVPEAKTDYIFSIIGEEFGFILSSVIILVYGLLFFRTILNGYYIDNIYLKLASYGLGMNIFFNAMVNVGVAMSALPSTGVTLPFISYGGTSLLVNSISIGLLLKISSYRGKE